MSSPRQHDPHQLTAALACAITAESNYDSDWIAKNGVESLFTVIRKLVPEVRIFSSVMFDGHSNECGPSLCALSMTDLCRFAMTKTLDDVVTKAKYHKPNLTS